MTNKTKTEALDLVTQNLADNSGISPLKHREVENLFINELYSEPIVNALDLSALPADVFVTSKFKRTGNLVNVEITLNNQSNAIVQDIYIPINNPLFFIKGYPLFGAETKLITGRYYTPTGGDFNYDFYIQESLIFFVNPILFNSTVIATFNYESNI
jgi:hypothetical protein